MSVQNKPDYKIFADGAKPGEVVTFPDVLRGWGVTLDTTGGIPPLEFFNATGKRTDEWLLYLTQRGIPDWDSSVDYPKSAMVMLGDTFYVSLKITKNEKPSTSQLAWKKFSDFFGVDGKLSKDQNGADIPNKDTFIKNIGLGEAAKRNVGTGVQQIPDMSSFTASLSNAGWQKLPSGLIIQWGSFTTAANITKQLSFPTAFPVACVGISITRHQPGSRDAINGSPVSRAEFAVQDYANGDEVFSMIALGY